MKIEIKHAPYSAVIVAPDQLRDISCALLIAAGVPRDDAQLAASSLVESDLRGINSHGIIRLPVYVDRLMAGGIAARTRFDLVRETRGTALYDAGNGLGVVATCRAMDEAISKARETGIGAVGIRNSNHNGEGAQYVLQATAQDMIGLATTNASPIMPVWGGTTPLTGPLPIAIGVPTHEAPIVLDMALGMSSRGKILYHAEKGIDLPPGWLVNAEGQPTTDPTQINKGGWILPIGGHKGWGLILMCEILSGLLTGGAFGKELTNLYDDLEKPQKNGHFVIAIDVAAFLDVDEFKSRLAEYVAAIKASDLAPGFSEIILPGEIERRKRARQAAEGITISGGLVDELLSLADRMGVDVEVSRHG